MSVAGRISLPHVQKFISVLECCSPIWGSVKKWGQGSCFTSDDMGCFNWGLTPLRTSQRSQQEFVTQSRGCPCPPLPCPSALLGSSCQVPHSSRVKTGQDGNDGGTSGWGEGVTILPQHGVPPHPALPLPRRSSADLASLLVPMLQAGMILK